MKALRWHASRDVRLDDVPRPGPPSEQGVQLEVGWCGICGTDVEEWRAGPVWIPSEAAHPLTAACAPLTLGHEFTGTVVVAGSRSGRAVGDRVAVDGMLECGRCTACRRGQRNLCRHLAQIGLMADGGLQELVNVPGEVCVPLPDGLDLLHAALAEPLSVAVRALRRGRLGPGEDVAVVGAGAIGLLALQVARIMGARHVTVVEPIASRRRLALELGADSAAEPGASFTADVVLECSGSAAAAGAALELAEPAGRVVLVGISSAPLTISPHELVLGEHEIIGSIGHLREVDFSTAVSLLSRGAVNVDRLIERVPLERALDDGLLELVRHPERHLKIVVSPIWQGTT
jgi:(R,R)-butanediol dehydrogenase/meso-butanediol dehydrogenase/diacetyl reductase